MVSMGVTSAATVLVVAAVCMVVFTASTMSPAGAVIEYRARALSAAQRMDPRAVALLQASPRLRAAFEHAKHNRGARVALKQQLTILCDEGRSHPEYWSLKTELDKVDGGEDDSDVLDSDGSFDDGSFGDAMHLEDKLHSMSFGSDSSSLRFKDMGMGDSFSDDDIIQDY